MKTNRHQYFRIAALLGVLLFGACKTLGIDSTFTFFLDKSFEFTVPTVIPIGQSFDLPAIGIGISNDELKSHNTELKYLKSAKLTKLDFLSSAPTAYPRTSFDTLSISMKTNSLPQILIGSYIGAMDSVILSYQDILPYVKDSTNSIILTFRANKAPVVDTKFTANYRLTFTADPLP